MKKVIKIFVFMPLFLLCSGIAKADSGPMSTQTTFYFQKNGQPITQPISFNVKCYGTSVMGDTDKLLKISEFLENCQAYGCKFGTMFEAYEKATKYCDIEGKIGEEKFSVNNFLGDNLTKLSCHGADFSYSFDNKYFKETEGYNTCKKDVYREYYPQGNGDVSGDFICHKSLVEAPKNECAGYGYIIVNDICYKFTSETYACIAQEDSKLKLCNQYLEDVTAKIAKNEDGHAFERICETTINILANAQPTVTPVEQSHSKGILNRIFNFFRCPFFRLFGKSC